MLNNLKTKLKLLILVFISLVALIVLGVMGILQLQKVNKGLETVYNDRVVPLEQLKIIADEYAVNIVDTTHQTRNGNFSFEKCIINIDTAMGNIHKQWNSYTSTKLTKDEASLVAQTQSFMDTGNKIAQKIKDACTKKDFTLLERITKEDLYPQIDPIGEKISALIKLQLDVAKNETDLAIEIYETSKIITLVAILISMLIISALAFYIILDITKKLSLFKEGLLNFFSYLNRENSSVREINIKSSDEFGEMAEVVNININKTQKGIEEDRELIDDAISVLTEFEQGDLSQRLSKNVSNPSLNELKDVLNKMANNLESNIDNILSVLEDYSKYDYIKTVDENSLKDDLLKLAKGVNLLGSSITEMLTESKINGLTLDESSDVLLKNVDLLNNSSNEAAASLEETAAALEEITSNIRNNTENIAQMSNLSKDVTKSAQDGEDLANKTTNAMEEINSQVSAINEAISVIDQIAFQTNILSLNAAVEAATAGEAGKGFAVVAAEVRNLASRSAEAAKEIKDLVENATVKANDGKHMAADMIDGYKKLNGNIVDTTRLISDIEMASKEQLSGIEQINTAVTQLDTQTQQNARIAAQTHDVSVLMDDISKLIVEDADSKEFKGKDSVKAKKINVDSNSNNNKSEIVKQKNEDSWENF